MQKILTIVKGEITIQDSEKETNPPLPFFPWVTLILFYVITSAIILPLFYCINRSLFYTSLYIILGNLLIVATTQGLHKWLEPKGDPHVFKDKVSVITRSIAGLLELIFYVLTIAFGWLTLLAGFLVMKSLSVWKHESSPSLEGASTAILRIAVILVLCFIFTFILY